jgi:hypothetical protein
MAPREVLVARVCGGVRRHEPGDRVLQEPEALSEAWLSPRCWRSFWIFKPRTLTGTFGGSSAFNRSPGRRQRHTTVQDTLAVRHKLCAPRHGEQTRSG